MSVPTPEKEITARAQSVVDHLTEEPCTIESKQRVHRVELCGWA